MSEEKNEATPEITEEMGEFSPELVELEDLETGEKHPFEILDAIEVMDKSILLWCLPLRSQPAC